MAAASRPTATTSAARAVALLAGDDCPSALERELRLEAFEVNRFDSVDALLDCDRAPRPVLVVACVDDPATSWPAELERLTRRFTGAPVLVVCSGDRRRAVRAALVAGASGVVLREEVDRAFRRCLQAVLAGQLCLPRQKWQEIVPAPLSSREKQVLGLVVMGFMNSEIAERLFVAESTVKSHLSSAFVKLGVGSRNEAAARILDPQSGLGVGILSLCGEHAAPPAAGAP